MQQYNKVRKSESVKSELLPNQLIFIAEDYHNSLARVWQVVRSADGTDWGWHPWRLCGVDWMHIISPLTGYGAITVQWPGTPKNQGTMGVHRLMVMWWVPSTPHLSARHHASHLCHHELCIKPAHWSMEPQWVNNERGNCTRRHRCLGHAGYPNCLLYLKVKI